MDLAIALWRINPTAEYRLNAAKDAIEEWRGPGQQPTPQQLTAAWNAYVVERDAAASASAAAATEKTAATSDLADQYAAAITRLDQIIGFTGTLTAAAVRDALIDLARIQRRTLRLLKAQVT